MHKSGVVMIVVGLSLPLPAAMLHGEYIDDGGGGSGGGDGSVVTVTRTLDWELPDWELSGSDQLIYQLTNGQLTRIELRDNTGAVVFSMSQTEFQAMIAQDPSLVASPVGEQSARVASPALAPPPHAPASCGGPFTHLEESIFGGSLHFNGNLH